MSGLFKIIIGIAILLGLVLLGTFISDKYSGNSQKSATNSPDAQLPISASEKDENEVKILAENFVRLYGTYKLGDFSNLESLKGAMTGRLWEEKSNYIKTKKQELENQPKKYFTYSAYPLKSAILFQKNNEAAIEVKYISRELKGAIIQGKFTIEQVDENGNPNNTSASIDKNKIATLRAIKENGEWKIDNIEIK